TGAFSGRPDPSARWQKPQARTPSRLLLTMAGSWPCRSSGYQSGISLVPRSASRVIVLSVPGSRTIALSSAGNADGGGGEPAGGGGVEAQSGKPGGTGAGGDCAMMPTLAAKASVATLYMVIFIGSILASFNLLVLRQLEHVKSVAGTRRLNPWTDGARHDARTPTTTTSRHSHVLLPASAKGDRETLNGITEARLPEDLPCLDVEGAEVAIQIAHKRHAAGRAEHGCQECRSLLIAPHFLHRGHIVGGELADVAIRSGHLEKAPPSGCAAGVFNELRLARLNLHARLAQRNDQQARWLVIAHRLPVVPAFRARARRDPLIQLLSLNVRTIGRHARLRVDVREDVLEHGLFVPEVFAGPPIDFPQHTRFANRKEGLLGADVDENLFENFAQVERLSWNVLGHT